jgi:diaminopimelate epimerase
LRFSIAAVSREFDRIAIEVSTDEAMGASITTTIKTVPSFGPNAVAALSGVTTGRNFSVAVAGLADLGRQHGSRGTPWSDSTMLSIGNPHCVTFVPAYDMLPSFDLLKRLKSELSMIADSPALGSTNPVFSDGCNLQWCFVESCECLHLRIVERGEGPTLASGSSAAAAVIAAFVRGLVDRRVTVNMPGGSLILGLRICNNEIIAIEISGEASCVAEIQMVDEGSGAERVSMAAARR